jgi:hypothetical protein
MVNESRSHVSRQPEDHDERIGSKLHSILAQLLQRDPETRPTMAVVLDYLDK